MLVTVGTFSSESSEKKSSNLSKSFEGPATVHRMKGYCVPTSVVEENRTFFIDNQSACPDDLAEFVAIQCFDPSKSDNVNIEDGLSRRQRRHCLNAKDAVELNKCGEGRVAEITKGRHYLNQNPLRSSLNAIISSTFLLDFLIWSIWMEITYASHYGPECLKPGRNSFPASEAPGFSEHKCGGAFVFVGDRISMAHLVKLTAYQPCWAYAFGVHLPNALERA
ncbi:hypothetical protein POTOM_004122 [Populus tomentosa]|uniref:Uncharacterized protein n=1 Tax=Populus tomentosa TaxID=118781 RepID=A0A8X8AGS0_POPTO|nr:hypothetical protein POTOM_004122 [Populus tomentosa]